MVYTFSSNPSLDYIMKVGRIIPDEVNRSSEEQIIAGGKGLNVALVLKNLEIPVKTLAITAGFTGAQWKKMVQELGIPVETIELSEGDTRINVKLIGVDQTEINANGPIVKVEDHLRIRNMFEQVGQNDILVLSGKGTPDMPDDVYLNMMNQMEGRNVRTIIDSTGDVVRKALCKRPFLLKPNVKELADITNSCIDTKADIIGCCERLIKMGARNVLVSMAGDGAIWVGDDGFIYEANAPKGRVKNSVGSGDSMVAAVIYGLENNFDNGEMLRFAVATGSASAFCENLATKQQVYDILNSVEVKKYNPREE